MSGFLSTNVGGTGALGSPSNGFGATSLYGGAPINSGGGGLLSSVSSAFGSAVNTAQQTLQSSFMPPPLASMNPNYLVKFSGKDEGGNDVNIIAAMPEVFDINTVADFRPLLPGGNILAELHKLAGGRLAALTGFAQGLGQTALTATGYSDQNVGLSKLVWISSSPLSFALPIQLNAMYNAANEVVQPAKQLLGLTLPTEYGGGLLRAPGPNILASKNSKLNSQYNINLSIGNKIKFTNIVVTNVQAQIDTITTSKGDWISIQLHVTVVTDRIYSKQDLDNAFDMKSQARYSITGKDIHSAANAAAKAGTTLKNAIPATRT